ncbi:MAG: SufS family cysteine desulfurase [Bdellovibrionota bacterium]
MNADLRDIPPHHSRDALVRLEQECGSRWKSDFPLLASSSIAYLDSAASAHKPKAMLDRVAEFFTRGYSNIHRGVYRLSEQATIDYEDARHAVQRFIGARSPEEIVFTRGTTESLNLVAACFAERFVQPGDELVVTVAEHHANFVPWQIAAQRRGAVIRYVGVDQSGRIDVDELLSWLCAKTKLVAISQLTNAVGLPTSLREIIDSAHRVGAKVVVDGAQGICHLPTNVIALDADFYAFSGHKLYGPTGIGILYGKYELLEELPPFLTGGDMIERVSVSGTTFQRPPQRFEAGTPHIAGALGLKASLDYIGSIGRERIFAYEDRLVEYLVGLLLQIPQVKILGPAGEHRGLVTFMVDGVHPHDLSQYLSSKDIAVRAGHHCAQPLLEHLKLQATTRASLGMYNTVDDVDRLIAAIQGAISFFR